MHRVDAGNNSDESDPSVAVGRGDTTGGSGRVYLGWQDGQNLPDPVVEYGTTSAAKIAMSTDHGVTFSAPVDVSTPLGIKNVQFPEVIAGDDDRAAFAWLGTKKAGDDQHSANVPAQQAKHPDSINPKAIWHLYVSTTYDGGATWTTADATPGNPVQRGCISLQGTSNKTATDKPCTQRNLLDFNDITVDEVGRTLVAYADGCEGACTAGTAGSVGAKDMVLRQSAGRGLYAAQDGLLDPGGSAPALPEVPNTALLAVGGSGVVLALLARRRRSAARG